jgi:hypothetical protein
MKNFRTLVPTGQGRMPPDATSGPNRPGLPGRVRGGAVTAFLIERCRKFMVDTRRSD